MGGCFSSSSKNPYPNYGPVYPGGPGPILTPGGVAQPLGPSVPVAYPQGKNGPPVVPLGPPTPHFNPGLVATQGVPAGVPGYPGGYPGYPAY